MAVPTTTIAALRAEAVGDWEACGDCFYCKDLLYDMTWRDIDLDEKRVVCGAYGGPIATIRDDSKVVLVKGAAIRPVFRIFDAAGSEVGNFLWEGGHIAGMGWSADEALMVVDEKGKVMVWSMHGERLPRDFTFGQEVEGDGVAWCGVYEDGIVVLTRKNQLWAAVGLQRQPVRPQRLAGPPLLQPPDSISILEPQFTLSSGLEVLVAVGPVVWVVDETSAQDHVVCSGTSILRLCISPDGQFVAAFTADGFLVVLTADFSKKLSELDTTVTDPPLEMAWCGVDAVVLQWEDELLVAGPYGDWARYPLDDVGGVVLVPERDGLRIISNARHELLRRVPDSVAEVFRPGGTGPGAQLWEARELYEARNPRADSTLRGLRPQLGDAVSSCMEGAGWDLSPPRQKALLKAAVYGRAFCPADSAPPPLHFHDICVKLRLLNAVRDAAVARPLTLTQLEVLTIPTLISRLINARKHMLAYHMAAALGAGQQGVLLHWACAKISAAGSMPDAELKAAVTARLKGCPGIRFAVIAEHAESLGRRQLALKLLEEETSSSRQVPLLLRLYRPGASSVTSDSAGGEEEQKQGGGEILGRALKKSIDSGDPDLVHLVLFHLHRNLPQAEFWALVNSRALARNLFFKYCRSQDPELLEQLLAAMSMAPEAADLALRRAMREFADAAQPPARPLPAQQEKFMAALADVAQRYSGCREHQFQSKAAAEWSLLRKEQAKLEKETSQQLFLGLSVMDTIKQCIRLGNGRAAIHIKKVLGVSDKRYAWLKIRTLAEGRDWDGLDAFAGEKKAHPVGWGVFLEAAKNGGAPREYVGRFIARLPDSVQKAEEWAALGCQQDAAEVAAKLRDTDLFARIQSAVSANSPAGLAIAQIKDRFASSFGR